MVRHHHKISSMLALLMSGAVLFAGQSLRAEENAGNTKLIRYAGIVQFIQGEAERVDASGVKVTLDFKTPFYEGEHLRVAKAAMLKMVTRTDCTVVIYGPAQVYAPEAEKPWRAQAEAVRWICPKSAREVVSLQGVPLTVGGADGGELLSEGKKLLVLSGQVRDPADLPRLKILALKDSQWSAVDPEEKSMVAAWNFNQSRRAPIESAKLAMPPELNQAKIEPKAEPAKTVRWTLGPVLGPAAMLFDKGTINDSNLSVNGGRLQMQRAMQNSGRGSLIFVLEYLSFEDKSKNNGGGGSTNFNVPSTWQNTHGSFLNAQVGYRFKHDRWWSPYVSVGGGIDHAEVTINTNSATTNYNSDVDYEFYMLSLSGGLDAYYAPSWFRTGGVYAALGVDVARSIGRGARSVKSEYFGGSQGGSNGNGGNTKPDIADEPWALTSVNLNVNLGLMLQF